MVAAVHQQPNLQFQVAGGALRRQAVGDVAGVGARLQPDALLQYDIADRETPNRHAPFQMERFEMNVAAWVDYVDTGPTIAEQRNFPVLVHQGGVGLGEYQPATERRPYRRHQQAVIASGQGAGHGASGVAAQTVRQPPLAPLGLRQIAAQRPATANETRDVIVHGITHRSVKIAILQAHFPIRHRAHNPRPRRLFQAQAVADPDTTPGCFAGVDLQDIAHLAGIAGIQRTGRRHAGRHVGLDLR